MGAWGGAWSAVGRQAYENIQSGEAITSDINASKIVSGAVTGAIIGGVVGVTAGAALTWAPAYGNLTQAADYGVQQGNKLKDSLSGTGLEVHHVIEQRLAPALGQSAAKAKEWLSVALTPEEHQVFTNAWRKTIGYINSKNPITTATATVDDVWRAAQDIYGKYPALLKAAEETIFGPE